MPFSSWAAGWRSQGESRGAPGPSTTGRRLQKATQHRRATTLSSQMVRGIVANQAMADVAALSLPQWGQSRLDRAARALPALLRGECLSRAGALL